MSKVTVQGFITTSGSVSKYPGIEFPREIMPRLVEAMQNGSVPMNALHDPRRRLQPTVLLAEAREVGNGELGVWVELEIDEEEWDQYKELQGFSATFIHRVIKPDDNDDRSHILVAADAGHFGDSELEAAATALDGHFSVDAGRLYQLAELSEIRVIVEMAVTTIQALPPNLFASAIYDALKHFLRRSERQDQTSRQQGEDETDFNFRLKNESTGHTIEASVRTNNEQHLQRALDSFTQVVRPELEGKHLEFDPHANEWRQSE